MAYLRYQTVRNVGIGVLGAGAIAGIIVAATAGEEPAKPQPVVATVAPATRQAVPTSPASSADQPGRDPLVKVAEVMLAPATNDKVKDLFNGHGPKVNLYDDDKDGTWDRAKIDYDRDEVDDEKITRQGGLLEKKNEKTGATTSWQGGRWVSPATAPTPEPSRPAVTVDPKADALAKVAAAMLAPARGDKVKDLFNGNGSKVNLYDDDKNGTWDRAKVDYERDDTDDEKLTLKAGVLEKKDERSGEVTVWKDGAWVAKPK